MHACENESSAQWYRITQWKYKGHLENGRAKGEQGWGIRAVGDAGRSSFRKSKALPTSF